MLDGLLPEDCDAGANRVELAFSTDSFVVTPKFFPGSNIGELAVNGTVALKGPPIVHRSAREEALETQAPLYARLDGLRRAGRGSGGRTCGKNSKTELS